MPRFLVVERLALSRDMEKAGVDMFVDAKASVVDVKANEMLVTWQSVKGPEKRVLTDVSALHTSLYKNFSPSVAYHIDAKDELELYHQFVLRDKHFSLSSFLFMWQLSQPKILNPNVPDRKICDKSFFPVQRTHMFAIFQGLDAATQKLLLANDPASGSRAWITPQMAKQMWLVYNDPRDLRFVSGHSATAIGYNSADPDNERRFAQIIPVADIPVKSYDAIKSSSLF